MFRANFLANASMALLLLFPFPICAVSQSNTSCNNATLARNEFLLAMEKYENDKWPEALAHLKKAAEFCAVPKTAIPPVVPLPPFGSKFHYIPFYFMGSCQINMEQTPDALRNFHLSSCFGEPKRDEDVTDDIGGLTDRCLKQIVKQRRPDKQPPYFSEGVKAKGKDWEQSAERMWDSMQVWPEDGKTTIIDGRWPVPYVPRFHLANALFELGCRQQACDQLTRSKLKELAAKDKSEKYDEELKEMKQLEAKCVGAKKGGPETLWVCQQWQCWLQRDRR